MIGKSITVKKSYRNYFNGRSGIIREFDDEIVTVQLLGSMMWTKFRLTDVYIN